MEGKALQVFNYHGQQLRMVEENGVAWFAARDIAIALDYAESSNPARLMQSVPEVWKGVKRIHTPGGYQEMLCLSENGVYFFLGRSDKPKAIPYQMWIAGEVMPSIRKHGMYVTPSKVEDILANPDAFIEVLQAYKAEKTKREALEAKVESDRPKVIFADALEVSNESILIGNLAKILRQNGIEIGQNRLFNFLREEGYLIRRKGECWNMPTQDSLERGLFEVKTRVINNADGSSKVVRTTKVTPKGQMHFVNMFLKGRAAYGN